MVPGATSVQVGQVCLLLLEAFASPCGPWQLLRSWEYHAVILIMNKLRY